MAKRKRVLITAIVAAPNTYCETFTHRQFFTCKPEHAEQTIRAVRSRFAAKHKVEQDAVTIEQSQERLHYHTPKSRGDATADAYNERRAIDYAAWLANRDGLAVPAERNIKKRCDWSGIYSEVKTRTGRHWDGNRFTMKAQATYIKRIRAVEWGTESKEEVYNTRKDGRRGAWLHNITHFEVMLRVEIPHWDFEHPEPVEELLEQAA